MREAGANQMAVLWKPGLRTEASALEEGREQAQDEETLLGCRAWKVSLPDWS